MPFVPGGATDILARLVGQNLTAAWGQQVVIDNRPGANGVLAADMTAKGTPEGTRCCSSRSAMRSIRCCKRICRTTRKRISRP